MITVCPYCRHENEGVRYWHKESDASRGTFGDPDEKDYSTVEMAMIMPCEHSFRRQDLREINEMIREKAQIERELEDDPTSFEEKTINERIEQAEIKLEQLVDKANAHMERTPPEHESGTGSN